MADPEPIEPEANDASAASLDAETLEDINKETRDLENNIENASSEKVKNSYYADYFKNMLTGDIGTKLLDSLKSIRNKLGMKSSAEDLRSGMEKINKYLEDNTETSKNFNKTLTDLQEKLKSGEQLPGDLSKLTPAEGKAVTEFLQKQGNGLWKELNKADSEIMDDLKKYINDNGGVIKDVKSAEDCRRVYCKY
jgi:predicted nuclease with TOPRIM domain